MWWKAILIGLGLYTLAGGYEKKEDSTSGKAIGKDKPLTDEEFKALQEKAIAEQNKKRKDAGLPPVADTYDDIEWDTSDDRPISVQDDPFQGFDDEGNPIWVE